MTRLATSPPKCLLIQPIDHSGVALLRAAGIDVVAATSDDDATVAAEIRGVAAVITRSAGLAKASIEAGRDLRVIGNHGSGIDKIDVETATAHRIPVVATPDTNATSVAELAVTLALAVAKRVLDADRASRAGDGTFKYRVPMYELTGKVLGIVGFGRTGRRTAEAFVGAFGMKLLVHSPRASTDDVAALGGRSCSLEELFAESDVVSLHVPLQAKTRNLIDAALLARMKPTAILVNTARGGIVDEAVLVDALRAGRLAGAGLDVLASEPLASTDPLRDAPNVVITPHIGGSSREAARRTAEAVARQVVDVLSGRQPTHLVNPSVWDVRRTGPLDPSAW